ncbi:MAG: ATP synthase F0 subunit B [Spirochaetaceae bacterium]|jgi:F-type H+-transporting ATPase subunit b|nr:ATP synthase F0 subunit B [Spirochaetaceae bacterium]
MLDFSVSFFFTLVNIAVLFIALRAILFKPVTKFMEERTAKVAAEIENAAKEKDEAKTLRQMYEEKVKNAGAEAARLAKETREAAEKQAADIISDAKIQGEGIVESARRQIQAERQAAFAAFRAEAAALVVAAAGRLLRRDYSGEDARAHAELVLRELGGRR